MAIHFITYGDHRYVKSTRRIAHEAHRTGCFDTVRIYTPAFVRDLLIKENANDAQKVLRMERGGGYWIWKPLIIRHALRAMHDGDMLLYADAGCTMLNQPTTIRAQLEKMRTKTNGVSHGNALGGYRCEYHRMDVLRGMGVERTFFNRKCEFEANRLLFVKNELSVEFVDEWATVALQRPDWFTDAPSRIPNRREFVEHRHDQTIYNCLAEKYEVKHGSCQYGRWLLATRIRE